MAQSHLKSKMRDKLYAILFLMGKGANGPRYVYLSVRMDELKKLSEAQARGTAFEPADYGRVLACGDGYPDADVKARMEDEYGFDHTDYVDLLNPADDR